MLLVDRINTVTEEVGSFEIATMADASRESYVLNKQGIRYSPKDLKKNLQSLKLPLC